MRASKLHGLVLGALLMLATPLARTSGADTNTTTADMAARVSAKVQQLTDQKGGLPDRLAIIPSSGGARPSEPVDTSQASLAGLVGRGDLKIAPDTKTAFSYVQTYQEPNDYAHRNYCGPGAAAVLLSHFDPNWIKSVDIDQLGRAMNMDPNEGVWVRDIAKPINDRLNAQAGQDLNWYRYGEANSVDDFRWMLNVDIAQNGVPLITSLQTGGLPGWGGSDVGHIVAVYGYSVDANGTEWVTYADTGTPASGYSGHQQNTVELGKFWQAVSQNSAQIW